MLILIKVYAYTSFGSTIAGEACFIRSSSRRYTIKFEAALGNTAGTDMDITSVSNHSEIIYHKGINQNIKLYVDDYETTRGSTSGL